MMNLLLKYFYGLQFIKLNIVLLEPGRLSTVLYNNGIKSDNIIKNIRLINDKSNQLLQHIKLLQFV